MLIHFHIDFYKFEQLMGGEDFAGSLAMAHKQAVAGLAQFDADRAKILDKDHGGQAVMVIAA